MFASAVWTKGAGKHNASIFSRPSTVKLNSGLIHTIDGLGSHEEGIMHITIEFP